jgi:hypothetical protein
MDPQEKVNLEARRPRPLWAELRAMLDLVLDFSFKRFVTPRLIRWLYGLSLLAALLAAVAWMAGGFNVSWYYGLFTVVTGPIAFVLYVLVARVAMEIILAIFQIAEHAQRSAPGRDEGPRGR